MLGTCHTKNVPSTILRILDQFPAHKRAHVRTKLASTLRAVVCQEIDTFLDTMNQLGASDLHIKSGFTPRFRVTGVLEEYEGFEALSVHEVHRLVGEILQRDQEDQFELSHEVDFSYGSESLGRFRVNDFKEFGGPAAVLRRISAEVPSLAELSLPESILQFAHLRSGLVLVTGPTGSGKSTTLAALIEVINTTYFRHIITLEDPIEYVFESKESIIHQRGLHHEMGALVFGTLHTNGAGETIDRIVDAFDGEEQAQIRAMLSQSLEGVISQVLVPCVDGESRVPATEVLVGIPAVSNIIREGKTKDLGNVLQTGRKYGMHSLDDMLEQLVRERRVNAEDALAYSHNKPRFERMLARTKA